MSAVQRPSREGFTARSAAADAIVAALSNGEYVGDYVRMWRREGRLDPRDAALAQEIALGSVRHALTLDHVLSTVARYDPRHVRPELRALLLSGAYQLIWLDRIPEFAIVDEAVRIARTRAGRAASGMVNAVLRNAARAIDARRAAWAGFDADGAAADADLSRMVRVSWDQGCVLAMPVFPAPDSDDAKLRFVAAAGGERLERVRLLAKRHGVSAAAQIVWASQASPVTVLQRNSLRVSGAEFVAGVSEIDPAAQFDQAETPTCAFVASRAALRDSALFGRGGCYVQDTTARGVATLVAARRGERIADWCAAPGGKSIALAIDQLDSGAVAALDVDGPRLSRIRENIERLGLRSVAVRTHGDVTATYDAVLADVPCSNTGVIARRPEARFSLNESKMASLVQLQQEILRAAARAVEPGGRLVYGTCSIEPEENELAIAAFAQQNPGWILEASELTLPQWGPRRGDWRDGGFAARLRRAR